MTAKDAVRAREESKKPVRPPEPKPRKTKEPEIKVPEPDGF